MGHYSDNNNITLGIINNLTKHTNSFIKTIRGNKNVQNSEVRSAGWKQKELNLEVKLL